MRTFLAKSLLIFAVVISAAGVAPAAHAQFESLVDSPLTVQQASQAAASVADPNAANAANQKNDKKTSPDDGYNYVMQKILQLFAWLVGVAALMLDYAVYYTVVKMGSYVNSLSAIGVTWRVLRDIGNIMLIFGFIAVGITTILNVDWYGGGKKMLPMMIVAAVFLNFSLFISEAIVDTGNLFATQFFTQINGGSLPMQAPSGLLTTTSGVTLTTANEGISTKLMNQLGLQTVYGDAQRQNTKIFEGANPWLIGFMGIILFIVTAFVMFSLAFVLIARFIALVFLLIVAPIGFAGLAIPGFAARAKDWWTQLFHQTITAPILLLMLYIALAVITDAQFMTGFGLDQSHMVSGGWWTGFVNDANLPGFASILLSFLVAMGLLLGVIVYAKRWSAFGGDWASRVGARLSFGATAWASRNTVGLGSNFLAKQARKRGLSRIPVLGTNLTKAFEYGAKSSFDVRGTGALKNIPFGSNIDAGKAKEGGYKEELKQRVEARTKYAAELKGKEFKDLSPEQQLDIMRKENEIAGLKKQVTSEGKAGTLTPERLKDLNKAVQGAENELDTMHERAGTERGGKLTYGRRLGNLVIPYIGLPAANVDAAKKIKEEARKTKDDKELDALRKALKKAGGEEGGGGEEAPKPKGEEAPAGGAGGGEAPAGH